MTVCTTTCNYLTKVWGNTQSCNCMICCHIQWKKVERINNFDFQEKLVQRQTIFFHQSCFTLYWMRIVQLKTCNTAPSWETKNKDLFLHYLPGPLLNVLQDAYLNVLLVTYQSQRMCKTFERNSRTINSGNMIV